MRFLGRLLLRVIRVIKVLFLTVTGYGVLIIVFREAYRLELPNPIRWLIAHWPSRLPFDF